MSGIAKLRRKLQEAGLQECEIRAVLWDDIHDWDDMTSVLSKLAVRLPMVMASRRQYSPPVDATRLVVQAARDFVRAVAVGDDPNCAGTWDSLKAAVRHLDEQEGRR